MYDAYLVNETDFVVQATAEPFGNVNLTLSQGLCALNTRYNNLKAFKIHDGMCMMGNISVTGKPDLNGSMVFVDSDHARATLDYGKYDLRTNELKSKFFVSYRLFPRSRQLISRH